MGTGKDERWREQWQQWLDALVDYRDSNGHTDIPTAFVTADGVKLGSWLARCHRAYLHGTLPADRAADLIAVGVDLGNRKRYFNTADEDTWRLRLDVVRAYRDEHGHTEIPHSYRGPDGDKLGSWLIRVRSEARTGKLPADRIPLLRAAGVEIRDPALPPVEQERWYEWLTRRRAELQALGVDLTVDLRTGAARERIESERWQGWLDRLTEFADEHGHANVPQAYVSADGGKLGWWLVNCRRDFREGRLSATRKGELIALGVDLEAGGQPGLSTADAAEVLWEAKVAALAAYRRDYGDLEVPKAHRTPEGFNLADSLADCRKKYRIGQLRPERIQELRALGVNLDFYQKHHNEDRRWADWIAALTDYVLEHGHADVPATHITAKGRYLGTWLVSCRTAFRAGKLPADRVATLTELGVNFHPRGS